MSGSSGNPLDRYLKPTSAGPSPQGNAPIPSGITTDPTPVARMIDFVSKSGKRTALPYAYLVSVTLVSNEQCEATFTEHVVTLKGRNLGALYQHILANTVRIVQESGSGFDAGVGECWIEQLSVVQRR